MIGRPGTRPVLRQPLTPAHSDGKVLLRSVTVTSVTFASYMTSSPATSRGNGGISGGLKVPTCFLLPCSFILILSLEVARSQYFQLPQKSFKNQWYSKHVGKDEPFMLIWGIKFFQLCSWTLTSLSTQFVNSHRKVMTSGHFVRTALLSDYYCIYKRVYTKAAGRKRKLLCCLKEDAYRRRWNKNWEWTAIGAEAINMTTQRIVCVC